jgi:DNA polymerase III subunit alpha
MSFVHLHNHTHYSILEWLPKPKDYIKKAKSLWMKAVAITDFLNIHGCHELYKYALEEWIKPILWTEILLQSQNDEKMLHKIVLLAKNYDWYKNIIALLTKANLSKVWDKIFITWDDLKEFRENLICLSWPISSEIGYLILSGVSESTIVSRIKDYEDLFPSDFYLELLYHDDIPKQRLVTDYIIELHKKHSFKVIAANDCYYIEKEDKKTQDIIKALWTGHQIDNPDRPTLMNWDYSFLSEEEMQMLFWFIPESLINTQEIADKIDIKIQTWLVLIPKYELPNADQDIYEEAKAIEKDETWIKRLTSDEWYLRYLTYKWLNWRYNYSLSKEEIFELVKKTDVPGLQKKLTESSPEELKALSLTYYTDKKKEFLETLDEDLLSKIERIEYELVVVHEMWFDAYFLIVSDYINWARNNDIPVWPWRWSAAWSLMAFLTWITDLDPLPYKLLFERFLNPARISMPDIDTDFSDDWRDRVIDYCRQKYWDDHVVQICTFGTFAARAAVKDVWRVMWIDFGEMNELAKLIPEKAWTKLKQALEESLEFKDAYDKNEKYKDIIDNALKIEWNVRQIWVHACAVIIAPHKMTNYTALAHPPKDNTTIITQYSAYPLEDLGLLKMDFLWLRNLSIIKRALKIIKNNKNVDINILNVPRDDAKVFRVFADWDTTWVFQFESDWMRKYLIDLGPDTFEDLIAMVSLYRPWPLAYIPSYIERKYWREELKYMADNLIEILKKAWYSDDIIEEEKRKLDEDLAPILDVSNWIAVYQEQLMFIVQYMAWFSLGEADLLRRWIWKKKKEIIEKLKLEFIEKAWNYRNYKKETPKYIYEEMIEPAANYSFNKSHAACYAFIAYQTAYLKAYYKTEFLTSVMVSDEENMERIVMEVAECRSKWINVLPPNVNESLKHFTYIDDQTIRFWLKAIKWIWDWPIEAIRSWREKWPYISLEDFVERTWRDVVNKKSLEALILSWSLDDFWDRWELFKNIENIIRYSRRWEKSKETNQIWLFDLSGEKDSLELEKAAPFTYEEKLIKEKDVIWFSISGHPLDWLSNYIEKRSQNHKILKMTFEEIEKLSDKQRWAMSVVQTIWYVNDFRFTLTKAWWKMTFLYCQSFYFDFEVTIFAKDYEKYKDLIKKDSIILINWNINIHTEYKRKSILSRDIKFLSLTQVRDQAISLWLFDSKKYNSFINQILQEKTNIEIKEISQENLPLKEDNDLKDESLEERIEEYNVEINTWNNNETNITEEKKECLCFSENESKFVIKIPSNAKKEDLFELKEFLSQEKYWEIKIFIDIKWQEADTKFWLSETKNLEKWINLKFS